MFQLAASASYPTTCRAGTWGSITHTGTEANNKIRTFSDGKQYLPSTDPSIHGSGGYATNASGSWVVHNVVLAAVHVLDIAERVPGELWLFGTVSHPLDSSKSQATAWRSTDNGTNWVVAYSDPSVPYTNGNGYERYYWGVALGGKIYMQARDAVPATPLRIFDGTSWTTGASTRYCSPSPSLSNQMSAQVEVFDGKVTCVTDTGGLRAFDNTIEDIIQIPKPSYRIQGTYVASGGYLYILAGNGSDSGIFRTNDLEGSFETIATDLPLAYSLAVKNDKIYLGGEAGKIYESDTTISTMPTMVVTPPDACFVFDDGTGTITDYYDHENNDPGQPACSRAVDIPITMEGVAVTTIGDQAFSGNQLTSLTIPNSVTTIGDCPYCTNQLTSIIFEGLVTTFGPDILSNTIASVTYDGVTYSPSDSKPEQMLYRS